MRQHDKEVSMCWLPGNFSEGLGNNLRRHIRKSCRRIGQSDNFVEHISRLHRENHRRNAESVLQRSQQLSSGKIFSPKQSLHIGQRDNNVFDIPLLDERA